MERLWSPWRSQYIQSFGTSDDHAGCVFCAARDGQDDDAHYLVRRHRHCFSLLNLYPYNSGHLLIIPYDHTASYDALSDEAFVEMWRVARAWLSIYQDVMHPQGFNLGTNVGRAGGAGIDAHVHLHLVPRWLGDINFMTSIGDTKVISEELSSTLQSLRSAWDVHQADDGLLHSSSTT